MKEWENSGKMSRKMGGKTTGGTTGKIEGGDHLSFRLFFYRDVKETRRNSRAKTRGEILKVFFGSSTVDDPLDVPHQNVGGWYIALIPL